MALARIRDRVEGSHIAIHAEHSIGHDQFILSLTFDKLLLKVGNIAVLVHRGMRTRKTASVNEAAVVELVRENFVALANEHGNHADVCRIAGRKHQRRFGALEIRKFALKLPMHGKIAHDIAACARSHAILVECGFRGSYQLGSISQTEIIVRCKVDDAFAGKHYATPLRHFCCSKHAHIPSRGRLLRESTPPKAPHRVVTRPAREDRR